MPITYSKLRGQSDTQIRRCFESTFQWILCSLGRMFTLPTRDLRQTSPRVSSITYRATTSLNTSVGVSHCDLSADTDGMFVYKNRTVWSPPNDRSVVKRNKPLATVLVKICMTSISCTVPPNCKYNIQIDYSYS